jgi:hypothetical protein
MLLFLFLAVSSPTAEIDSIIPVPPKPPENVRAFDTPNDAGGSIAVEWDLSENDSRATGYEIVRADSKDGKYESIGAVARGSSEFTDRTAKDRLPYYYQVRVVSDNSTSSSDSIGPVSSSAQWFHTGRMNMLIAVIVLCGLIIWFISQAKKGKELYVRPIGGLSAIDEAVGRATELGRPVLYVPGIMDMDNIQTIAAITILGRVARKTAEYEAQILVPTSRSLVMTTAQETVKEAYYAAGKPDRYNQNNVRYLTDDQFAFAAGVDGMMVREKPGAIFFMGCFYAESLILAETGNSTGAIQIAGTAMPSQLPFFVATCDYTLMGEELFAAGAYLSQDPLLLGSLKGQDWGKALLAAVLVFGVILATFGVTWLSTWLIVR